MTVTLEPVGGIKDDNDRATAVIQREYNELGETFLSLTDIINLCEVSRDRYKIEGAFAQAEAMERMALVLETVAIIF